jgi:hypothetical protein
MATYLQGVTDYIPEFQPFQPDLNFYANVMQTKQNQYDTNYKAVNNLYGELYDAELTHEKNIEKKDQLLKNLDFELKRVSGLDLSLEQNVNQAKQVFKPFYQDKYLMKDMAYTKNFNSTLNRAKALQNNPDEKQRNQYWDVGIKDMMYRREEFRNADLEKTLNMSDAEYTPYVNAAKVYRELAKEMNLSVDIEKPDASGMYMVRQKNGDLILPTLQKLFLSEYTNNPALQKVYATEAYVKRNDYIAQNAERFKGDKLAAEKEYLRTNYNQLKDYTAKRAEAHQEAVKVTTNKMNAVENSIEKGDVNPAQNEYLRKLNQMYEINTKVSNYSTQLNEQLNGQSTTTSNDGSSSESDLDLNNMELARLQVDSGIAAFQAEQHIKDEADFAARKDMIFTQDFSKLYMENLNHQHAMQRQSISDARADARETAKLKAARILERDKSLVASGAYVYDINGDITPNPAYAGTYTGDVPPGGTEVKVENIKKLNAGDYFEKVSTLTSGYAKNMYSTIANLYQSGKLDNTELWGIMHPNETPKANQNYADAKAEFYKEYYKFKENSEQETNNLATSGKLFKYRNQLKKWAAKNFGSEGADLVLVPDPENDRLANHDASVQQFEWYTKEYYKIKKTNDERIDNALMKSLSTGNYTEQTKKEIVNLYKNKFLTGKIDEDQFDELVQKYIIDKYEKNRMSSSNVDYVGSSKNKKKATGESLFGIPLDDNGNADFNISFEGVAKGSGAGGTIQKMHERMEVPELSALKTAYYNIVSNADKKTGLLSTLPTLINGKDGKATLAANEASAIVNIGAVGTFGNKAFFETLNDITRINFKNDPNKYRITLNGNSTRDAADDLNSESAKYKDFLRALSHTIRDKTKPEDFILTQSQIAFEDKNLGAMTIKVPRSFAEKYFKTDDGTTDAELVNKLVEKGITFVAPKYEWKNSLFLNNKTTPVQAVINASVNNTLEYKDPSNAGNYTIEKFGDGSYRANVSIKEMGPDGKAIVSTSMLTSEQLGNNVDLLVHSANNEIALQNKENLQKYREFHAAGNTDAMRNAEKEFGFIPKNFGWKY